MTNIRLQADGQWLVGFKGYAIGQRPNLTQAIDLLLSWLRSNVKEDVFLAIETIQGRIDYYHYASATGVVTPEAAVA